MRNPLSVPKYPPTALSAQCQAMPHGSALEVLDLLLPQHFSLQIWKTTQNLALIGGLMSLQCLVNPCVSLRLYKYVQCNPVSCTFSSMQQSELKRTIQPWEEATKYFSHTGIKQISSTTTQQRQLETLCFLSYTPAFMQTSNACMTILAVNSNKKSTKTTSSSSILSSLQLFLNRQVICFCIIAASACTDISYK